jgi:MFS family permease
MQQPPSTFAWPVVRAAFVVALFGWGVGFYGPPIFLATVHETRGWSVSLVSAALTAHYLAGAAVVASMHRWHRQFGVGPVTLAGAAATALGILGWAAAQQPWQLFAAALVSGAGWASTGPAAINAIIAPWFERDRPVALSLAYNGASVGGAVFSPAWVLLIAALGFGPAAAAVGAAMVAIFAVLAAGVLARTPPAITLEVKAGDTGGLASTVRERRPLPAVVIRDGRFVTLALPMCLALFAQIGLIAHLFSLMLPALGAEWAGMAMGLATACAVAGRMAVGRLLQPGTDRRLAAAASLALQILGCLSFILAGGEAVPLLVLGVVLFGLGIGNATSLPPLIAQAEFRPADVARCISLITAVSQASYAFAPAAFGVLREALLPVAFTRDRVALVFAVAALIKVLAAAVYILGRERAGSGGSSSRRVAESSKPVRHS